MSYFTLRRLSKKCKVAWNWQLFGSGPRWGRKKAPTIKGRGKLKQSGSKVEFGPIRSARHRAEHFLLTSIVNYSWRVIFWTRPARANDHGMATAIRSALRIRRSHQLVGGMFQAIFRRRRHQPRRLPLARDDSDGNGYPLSAQQRDF